MSLPNRTLAYRPLLGGIAVYNPIGSRLGTLGFIGVAADQTLWAVSCYHILCRADGTAFAPGEPIYQPIDGFLNTLIGRTDQNRADVALDCAAIKLIPTVAGIGELLEIGRYTQPVEAQPGMRVLKSGITTGVTEGVVAAVNNDMVEIEAPVGYPIKYDVCTSGDSGALWVTRDSHAPVALHTRSTVTGKERAFGLRIQTLLHVLDLQLLIAH